MLYPFPRRVQQCRSRKWFFGCCDSLPLTQLLLCQYKVHGGQTITELLKNLYLQQSFSLTTLQLGSVVPHVVRISPGSSGNQTIEHSDTWYEVPLTCCILVLGKHPTFPSLYKLHWRLWLWELNLPRLAGKHPASPSRKSGAALSNLSSNSSKEKKNREEALFENRGFPSRSRNLESIKTSTNPKDSNQSWGPKVLAPRPKEQRIKELSKLYSDLGS